MHQVIEWFTSFNEDKFQQLINNIVTIKAFFEEATTY